MHRYNCISFTGRILLIQKNLYKIFEKICEKVLTN
nr:MAG TPA: hypothetical protein [Caudoviricetes sp.]